MSREQDDIYTAPNGTLSPDHPVYIAADAAFARVLNILDRCPPPRLDALLIVWAPSEDQPGTVDQTLVGCCDNIEDVTSRLTSALETLLEPEVFSSLARALARREADKRGHP